MEKIKNNFESINKNDINLFKFIFFIFIKNKQNENKFIINFNILYKILGHINKLWFKFYLFKKFKNNKDYIIYKNKKYDIKILLNIECYKKYCLYINTYNSNKLYDFYIQINNLVNKYYENKLLTLYNFNFNNIKINEQIRYINEQMKFINELNDIIEDQYSIIKLHNNNIDNDMIKLNDKIINSNIFKQCLINESKFVLDTYQYKNNNNINS